MKDGVSAVAVFVVRTATRVPCLAFLAPIRFQGTALMIVVMCVMTDMLHCSRTLFVQAIRRQNSGSPLQRQKQHEKSDHEITHGVDCRLPRQCRHLAGAAARHRRTLTNASEGRHSLYPVMQS